MKASFVRRCLEQLNDSEIDEILAASRDIQDLVRSAATGKGAGRVDASLFRKWLRIPNNSNKMLGDLPHQFAAKVRDHADQGLTLERTVGVRVLLALASSEPVSVQQFAAALAEIRSQSASSLTGAPPTRWSNAGVLGISLDGVDISTDLSGFEVSELYKRMVQSTGILASALASATSDAQDGYGIDQELMRVVEEWHNERHQLWDKLGVAAPPREFGLSELERIRDLILVAEEARRAAADDARRAEQLDAAQVRLKELTESLPSLEKLAELDAQAFGQTLHNLRQQIADTADRVAALKSADGIEHTRSLHSDLSLQSKANAEGGDGVVELATTSSESASGQSGEAVEPALPSSSSTEMSTVSDNPDLVATASAESIAGQLGDVSEPALPAIAPIEMPAILDHPEVDITNIVPKALIDHHEQGRDPVSTQRDLADSDFDTDAPSENFDAKESPRLSKSEFGEIELLLASSVRQRKFGAAWVIAQSAGLSGPDIEAYRAAAAAFHSAPGRIDPSEALTDLTTLVATSHFVSVQSARVALASMLRSAMAAGWIPRSEVESLTRHAGVAEQVRALQQAITEAVERHYQHLHSFGNQFGPTSDEVRETARELKEQIRKLRTKFVRADKVLMYLLRSQEPLGAAIEAVGADTRGDKRRAELTEARLALQSPDALISAADAKVSTPQQRRTRIVKGARATLDKAIESVTELVTDALNAEMTADADTRAATTLEAHSRLIGEATAVQTQDDERDGPGDLALRLLADWILDPTPPDATSIEELLLEEALPAVSAPRDSRGLPTPATNLEEVVSDYATDRSNAELFRKYSDRGDLQQAAIAADGNQDLLALLPEQHQRWERILRNELSAVRAEIARTFADTFSEGDHSDAEALLVEPESYAGTRFDLQISTLEDLRAELDRHRENSANRLRKRVADEISRSEDRARIDALIDSKDLVAANELFSLALAGPLPNNAAEDAEYSNFGAQVFTEFARYLGTGAINGPTIRDVVQHMAAAINNGPGGPLPRADLSRLNAWDHLSSKRSQGNQRRQHFASVLGELGLNLRGDLASHSTPGSGYTLQRITAEPADGSLVPGLGSQATHYMILVTRDANVLQRQALVSAFPDRSGPNIVLFDGVLSIEQRRQCLHVCRNNQTSAIVVDHAVAAYVAMRHRRSFKTAQQLTLPFTCFTHYTLISGHVPDEVFVGRAAEQRQLAARDGSLFVYGGRQLGKTALLKRTAQEFNSIEDQQAIFVDLSVHGIGKWAESQQLWQVLFNELAKIKGMQLRPNPNVRTSEPVRRAISNWLAGKETRRLLVLLDEADAFLEKESVPGPEEFKHIQPLRGLFFESGGRFKPVFAGLHRVQRLQNVANTPLAHGGNDILVGPLTAKPAYELVVRPLEALGYRFDNEDLVWRLLAYTNMQPGLIQLVCDQLVVHMQRRPLHKGEPLIVVRADDVDAVTQNEHTKGAIADKFRLTIDLEVRYRVIALTVAIMCMDDQFRERYTAADIRLHCETYWEDGFADLNSPEFTAHLNELIGLGVLTKDGEDRYSVRSPNIVTMLGTRDQLATVLTEAEFELEPEYNPRSTRRLIENGKVTYRSPLSEDQLSTLLPMRSRYAPHNFVIIGSSALNVDRVVPTLRVVGEQRLTDIETVEGSAADVQTQMAKFTFTGGANRRANLLIIDATTCSPEQAEIVADGVQRLRRRNLGHLIVVYGTAGVDAASSHLERQALIDTSVWALEKWSGDGIRFWHDNPFRHEPGDRRQLLAATGGWPDLVDRAVLDADRGAGNLQVCLALSEFPSTENEAREFLGLVGVDERTQHLLGYWAEYRLDTYESLADIADILERDRGDMRALLTDLCLLGVVNERDGSYLLDPVVTRALMKTRSSSIVG